MSVKLFKSYSFFLLENNNNNNNNNSNNKEKQTKIKTKKQNKKKNLTESSFTVVKESVNCWCFLPIKGISYWSYLEQQESFQFNKW